MSAIRPNKEQFMELMQAPDDAPVVMLNLLKFKDRADGGTASGEEEYAKYGSAAVRMVEASGGQVLWMGAAEQILIGDPTEGWDAVALVRYPSRKAFIEMTSKPEYETAHEHRERGLERTVLIACRESANRLD